eukprot:scaffold428147_cov36-Prasinocladus_malaysianus.AAC.1
MILADRRIVAFQRQSARSRPAEVVRYELLAGHARRTKDETTHYRPANRHELCVQGFPDRQELPDHDRQEALQ